MPLFASAIVSVSRCEYTILEMHDVLTVSCTTVQADIVGTISNVAGRPYLADTRRHETYDSGKREDDARGFRSAKTSRRETLARCSYDEFWDRTRPSENCRPPNPKETPPLNSRALRETGPTFCVPEHAEALSLGSAARDLMLRRIVRATCNSAVSLQIRPDLVCAERCCIFFRRFLLLGQSPSIPFAVHRSIVYLVSRRPASGDAFSLLRLCERFEVLTAALKMSFLSRLSDS